MTGQVPLVLDLHIDHERFGSRSETDYNNRPSNLSFFMSSITSMSGSLHSEFVSLFFLQSHRETDRFFAVSGNQLPQSTSDQFHYHFVVFSSQFKSKTGKILDTDVVLHIMPNIDGTPIGCKSHTHPSHFQTSRLLTSSLSLGVPVPHETQCM